jgi:hypothetical protein
MPQPKPEKSLPKSLLSLQRPNKPGPKEQQNRALQSKHFREIGRAPKVALRRHQSR